MGKIYLISPPYPCGLSWLINCFLELGIKTYRKNDTGEMWLLNENNEYILNPNENDLKRWLPILSNKTSFKFLDNLEAEWQHSFPKNEHLNAKIIYFIRDPRDAFFSMYKLHRSKVPFEDYIKSIEPYSLLDRINHWVLFNLSWMNLPNNIVFFRFEDYRNNPFDTLKRICLHLNLRFTDNQIQTACENSSFEKAKKAEELYVKDNYNNIIAWKNTINKGIPPGNWKVISDKDYIRAFNEIEEKTHYLLKLFGYEVKSDYKHFYVPFYDDFINLNNYFSDIIFNNIYKDVKILPDYSLPKKIFNTLKNYTFEFLDNLNLEKFEKEVFIQYGQQFINKYLSNQNKFEEQLKIKWKEIPVTRYGREFSHNLLQLSDDELLQTWQQAYNETMIYNVRGWYHDFYKNFYKNKKLLDLGCGIGIDGVTAALNGAYVTFADIIPENLEIVKRICHLKNIEAEFYLIDDFFNFQLNSEYDIVMAIGSLINTPIDFVQKEIQALDKFVKVNGKFLFLGYPEERFIQSGAKDQHEFGKMTDGERTPWCEWYNDKKIQQVFGKNYKLNFSLNFGKDNIEFNWFDLTKVYNGSKNYSQIDANNSANILTIGKPSFVAIQNLPVSKINEVLAFEEKLLLNNKKRYENWKMEDDDAPIFRYIYRNFKPKRHLEFGTWYGEGTTYCLEESDATVWTINLPFGEVDENNQTIYSNYDYDLDVLEWAKKIGFDVEKQKYFRTDMIGFIGRKYIQKKLGNRVCQIYCDSREWDITNFPEAFFDTVLIDGGHKKNIIINDTIKALKLIRNGGLIMWHDFCPPMVNNSVHCYNSMDAITAIYDILMTQLDFLYWIEPSYILIGKKKNIL